MMIYNPTRTKTSGQSSGTRLNKPIAKRTIPTVLLQERKKNKRPPVIKKYSQERG
jgi:hypothetical protein